MVKKDILGGKPPIELENPPATWDLGSDNSFDNIGKEKVDSLKRSISEIKLLIKEREKLSRDVIEEGDKEKRDIDNFSLEVKAKMEAGDIEGEKERITLRQKRVDLSELQLKEKISSWQDVAKLKQELREQERELSDREGRMKMLGKILEE
jgi:hypothetical protein